MPKFGEWILIKIRPLTDEEKESYGDYVTGIYDCKLPDYGEEVLIQTTYGSIEKTTFVCDCDGAEYFEDYDEDEVLAWMPLPEPYESEKERKD